jgi:hypothetical protein
MMAATNRPLGSAATNKMHPVATTGTRISYASIDCDAGWTMVHFKDSAELTTPIM